jgi:hypothetical protein
MATSVIAGDRVKIYHDGPGGTQGLEGTVRVVQDETEHPGKLVGVELNHHHPIAHEIDGLVPHGYGWWTRPENLEVLPTQ